MILIPAALLSTVLLGLATVHVYWACRGIRGLDKVVPTRDGAPLFKPGLGMTLLVAAALFIASILPLWRVGTLDLGPEWVPRVGVWAIAAVFALRAIGDFRYVGFFKRVRGTVFAHNDTFIFSPLCCVISALAAWLAAGS